VDPSISLKSRVTVPVGRPSEEERLSRSARGAPAGLSRVGFFYEASGETEISDMLESAKKSS